MADPLALSVNGAQHLVSASPDTPLLYVLRKELKLSGPRMGCGLAQCGACAVLVDGAEVRSCIAPPLARDDKGCGRPQSITRKTAKPRMALVRFTNGLLSARIYRVAEHPGVLEHWRIQLAAGSAHFCTFVAGFPTPTT